MKDMKDLGVPVPTSKAYIVRNYKSVTVEQRARTLKETEYNMFSFPADLLNLDFLSDSGSTSMTDLQWSALIQGDESYGRNKGYYCLLDSVRDVFERGNSPRKVINYILTGEEDVEKLMKNIYLTQDEGGFANGGVNQLKRPNAFICPQGRASEFLLFHTLKEVLDEINPNGHFTIPNNGHFDTTGANIRAVNIDAVNLFKPNLLESFPHEKMDKENPFKGDMDVEALERLIKERGVENIPLIYLTITNNTAAGQPVSMKNIRTVHKIAEKYEIPLFFDACRFAENAIFIKKFEEGYSEKSVRAITQEMFSYADGFTISFKKDGLANMGGGLFIRDEGRFVKKYSINNRHIGVRLKERQILTFGNDSYGGLSGRDIMTIAIGLQEVMRESYLESRLAQSRYFASELAKRGIPVVLPAGAHAVYIDMDKFFKGIDNDMKTEDFGGVGFTIELVKYYGIRACELGPFAFEWDLRTPEQRKGILNLVRFAIPRNAYSNSDLEYAIAAVEELYKNRDQIPKVRIVRGANLSLRHFQSGLKPEYPKKNISSA